MNFGIPLTAMLWCTIQDKKTGAMKGVRKSRSPGWLMQVVNAYCQIALKLFYFRPAARAPTRNLRRGGVLSNPHNKQNKQEDVLRIHHSRKSTKL